MNAVKTVALYARVSTDEQNTEAQLAELRLVAEKRGWTPIEYVDEGVSGSKDRRPALDRMMADVRRGKIDVVAVWRFDRFARSASHLIRALDEFRTLKVEFVSLHEAVDTNTATGRLVYGLFALLSEFELDLLKERTRAGLRTARRRGVRLGRPSCKVDADEAKAMKAEGLSVRAIAAKMGKPKSAVHRALTAETLG